jgi:hypothetical protein
MITYIAVAQIVPFILFPWPMTLQSFILVLVLALLCAFLGWALWSHKPWGRKLTIFTQGLNIVIRLITLFGNVYTAESGFKWMMLITYLCSMALSWLILSYIDKPEVQLIFES